MAQIQPGAVVRLKSGGPLMTVKWKAKAGGYACDWFIGDEHKVTNFAPEQLDVLSDEEVRQALSGPRLRSELGE